MKNIPPSRLRRIRIWKPGQGTAEIEPNECLNIEKTSLIDLASNDYLSLSRHPDLIKAAYKALTSDGIGAGASRLITGTREIHIKLEQSLAEWLGKERVFLFPSGFQANIAAVMTLANRHTNVIADRMIHNSLLTGIKASGARLYRYEHNDLNHLEQLLNVCNKKSHNNSNLIITEGLFSMEGSSPNIRELAQLSLRYKAKILIDEAHAIGVMGYNGKGLSNQVTENITMISGTFGKAFGSGGAFVASDEETGENLLQNSGAFRYTTALAPSLAAASLAALTLMKENPKWHLELQMEAKKWRTTLEENGWNVSQGNSPIISLIVGSDDKALYLERHLEKSGIATIAIRPPTVPEGTARLRIVLRRGLPKRSLDLLIKSLGEAK